MADYGIMADWNDRIIKNIGNNMATYEYLNSGKNVEVQIEGKGEEYLIKTGDRELTVEACKLSDHLLSLSVNGELIRAFVAQGNGKTYVHIGGKVFAFVDAETVSNSRNSSRTGLGTTSGAITSPMPGNVIKLMVKEGDAVVEGQPLVIVEAMKMENEIRSPSDGVVKKVNYAVGDLVEAGVPIVELETEEE